MPTIPEQLEEALRGIRELQGQQAKELAKLEEVLKGIRDLKTMGPAKVRQKPLREI